MAKPGNEAAALPDFAFPEPLPLRLFDRPLIGFSRKLVWKPDAALLAEIINPVRHSSRPDDDDSNYAGCGMITLT